MISRRRSEPSVLLRRHLLFLPDPWYIFDTHVKDQVPINVWICFWLGSLFSFIVIIVIIVL